MKESQPAQNDWHLSFGEVLKWDLIPVGVLISPEAPVMIKPPRADILILPQGSAWTSEQLERLPDGIRQSTARHILIEFKYTQSISDDAIVQSLAYDWLYRNSKKLTTDEVQTFLVSAIKPQENTRKTYGYKNQRYPGVYESQYQLVKRIQLISLNELADEPYNAVFKVFATHLKEKQKAFKLLEQSRDVSSLPRELESLLFGLLILGEQDMNIELTPKQVREMGKMWGNTYLSCLSPEERLAGVKPSEVMGYFKPEERFAGVKPSEVMSYFKPEERLAGLSMAELEEQIKKLKQENGNQ